MHQRHPAIISTITIAIALASTCAESYFFFLEAWNNGAQKIYCFADRHIAEKESNHAYHKQVNSLIEKAEHLNAYIVAQDSDVVCAQLLEDPLNFDPNNYIINIKNLAKIVARVLQNTISTIKKFTDEPVCNEFYAKNIALVKDFTQKHFGFFALFKDSDKSIGELLADPQFVQEALKKIVETNLHWNLHNEKYYADSEKMQKLYANPVQAIMAI